MAPMTAKAKKMGYLLMKAATPKQRRRGPEEGRWARPRDNAREVSAPAAWRSHGTIPRLAAGGNGSSILFRFRKSGRLDATACTSFRRNWCCRRRHRRRTTVGTTKVLTGRGRLLRGRVAYVSRLFSPCDCELDRDTFMAQSSAQRGFQTSERSEFVTR